MSASPGIVSQRWAASAACIFLAGALGCGAIPSFSSGDTSTPSILGLSVGNGGSDSDGTFENAEPLLLPSTGSGLAYNSVATEDDVDVFDLGVVTIGEQVTVSVEASDAVLDPVAGLFDSLGRSLLINDDISYYGGNWNASLTLVIRHAEDHLYLAVSGSPKSLSTGNYAMTIGKSESDSLVAPENPQFIYLNFSGGNGVVIGPRAPVDVPPFDAEVMSSRFEGQSEAIALQVVQMIEEDFRGFNVVFLNSLESDPPDEPYSTLHFGAYDPGLLGVAENVDEYNERLSQPAIVFVDTFAAFDVLEPNADEISQALANVASHEIGHLLGLNHTYDIEDLMDVTASLRELTVDQTFGVAPLDPAVFPVGDQDSVALVLDAVGGDAAAVRKIGKLHRAARWMTSDPDAPDVQREGLMFGLGCHAHREAPTHP